MRLSALQNIFGATSAHGSSSVARHDFFGHRFGPAYAAKRFLAALRLHPFREPGFSSAGCRNGGGGTGPRAGGTAGGRTRSRPRPRLFSNSFAAPRSADGGELAREALRG